MSNIASLLKAEISRVARREIRAETASLKKAVSAHRAEIAALKRHAQALQAELKRVARGSAKQQAATPAADAAAEEGAARLRFSAKGLVAQRKRLGLSAHEFGLLVGTSSQSIYNWEAGTARPRRKFLPAIAQLRSMGKREIAARLKALHETPT